MRSIQFLLGSLMMASVPAVVCAERLSPLTAATAHHKLRALFTADQLPCPYCANIPQHVAGVATCVDTIQKGFFACDTSDIDCQCNSLVQLELSCYGICPQSPLLVEIASTINDVCSQMVAGTEFKNEPAFMDEEDDELEPNFINGDDGAMPFDFNEDGDIVLQHEPELEELEDKPYDNVEPTADEAAVENAESELESEPVPVAEPETVITDPETESAEAENDVSAADPETVSYVPVEEAPAADASAEEVDVSEATEDVTMPEADEYNDYPAVSEDSGNAAAVSEHVYAPKMTAAAAAPQATPKSNPMSPMATPAPATPVSAANEEAAAAAVTTVPVFVAAHTVMTDTDATMTVTYPHFQGYTDMPLTATDVAMTAGDYPIAAKATAVPLMNSTVQSSKNSTAAPMSNSTGAYGYYYNSTSSASSLINGTVYANTSMNYTHNGTYPDYDSSSSRNLGMAATVVLGAAIGVAVALL
ncbi:hypothetical protein V1512DRAFT_252231 [Lipomyces arxii]|uniref:uncharacterized protein n=1 Tax=Lipomyces arxii TaxID=56418 RepID=UPI0034CF4821